MLGGNTVEGDAFSDDEAGWKIEFNENMTELEFWKLTFPPEVITFVVEETNKYARQQITRAPRHTKRSRKWKDIGEEEFLRYLAIRLIIGMDKKPELSHYWSSDPIFRSAIVPQIMSSDRFFEIQRYLHFSDTSQQQQGDKLHKIRQIWSKINNGFGELLVSVHLLLSKFSE